MSSETRLHDPLLQGRILQDDGMVAEAQERLATLLKRLKARRLKSGWILEIFFREDLNNEEHPEDQGLDRDGNR